jgi:hypothetical protein
MAKKEAITQNESVLLTDTAVTAQPKATQVTPSARPGLRQIAQWYKFPLLVFLLSLLFMCLLVAAYKLGQHSVSDDSDMPYQHNEQMWNGDDFGPRYRS